MRRDVQEIFRSTPHGKQVMMFSATLSKEIRPVCKKFMQDVNINEFISLSILLPLLQLVVLQILIVMPPLSTISIILSPDKPLKTGNKLRNYPVKYFLQNNTIKI